MNTIWSTHIQGIHTLYDSRRLRFDDLFAPRYKPLFGLEEHRPLKILEIGCGPGALAGALRRWYPKAEITAVDRDSAFIAFAARQEPGIAFLEGDATSLPFADVTFDVTISNTVAEHIEPGRFYGEQLRVLKPGGICLVLSSRRGIAIEAECLRPMSDFEQAFWEKAERHDNAREAYSVGRYAMSESELPASMEAYGFRDVGTGYAAIALTPDSPQYSRELARDMIHAERYGTLERIEAIGQTMPEHFTAAEVAEMGRLIHAKYDARMAQYDRGEKQWDTTVSLIQVTRGCKPIP